MDPERTSRDDLDVRLDWPGAEPTGPADTATTGATNGAAREAQPAAEVSAVPLPRAESAGVPVPQELELETIRATLALMSARIEALAGAVEGSRLSHHAVAAAIERFEHSVSLLSNAATDAHERSTAAMVDIRKTLAESVDRVTRQLEALRRRITLRGRSEQFSYEEMIELIAEAVAERLPLGGPSGPTTAQRRRRREQ
ncbi:MAG TPA: hypothetical protein VMO88_10170 [Acidimicrobiales bacterium]|nr:hypothetical protein [Acidimicrobiales bacterium]